MSLVNSILKYATEKLHLRFRSRLTSHLLQQYMSNNTFYKTADLLPNIDQLISTDVDRFSSTLAQLYSQMAKPVLDIIIYVYGISTSVGKSVPGYMMGYLALAASILIRIRKPMARLTAKEQALEGEFRFANSRLQVNAEEVAFYGGNKRELVALLGSFKKLVGNAM
jgi:ATP-binding cassette subfamily D (ALD) protein 3